MRDRAFLALEIALWCAAAAVFVGQGYLLDRTEKDLEQCRARLDFVSWIAEPAGRPPLCGAAGCYTNVTQ